MTEQRDTKAEGCFVLDQRRGTCQLGTGTLTFLKKGEEEEESSQGTLMNERDCSAIRKLDRSEMLRTLHYLVEQKYPCQVSPTHA